MAAVASIVLVAPGAAAGPGSVDLKRAVNFAIDRQAMLDQRGAHAGVVNDQYLPPGFPGYVDAAIYPSRPDIARARELAGWKPGDPTRKAVMYTCSTGPCVPTAQIVQANLAEIGIDVEIQIFPRAVQFTKTGTRGEPFDLTLEGWHVDYYDPYDFLFLLDGGTIRAAANTNMAYYDDPDYRRRLFEANALAGDARIAALGALDVHAASTSAPLAGFMTDYSRQFFSGRIGCHSYHGPTDTMSLADLCLRPSQPGDRTEKIFRWQLDADIDYVDPALAYYVISWQIEHATCARLVNYATAGSRLEPEIAQGLPTVSADGRTYTFTLRDDFFFSPPWGVKVEAAHFKHALQRLLDPRMASPGQWFFSDIVGADDMLAGRASELSGVTASGNTLTITLVRPAGDFLARLAMPFSCPLPLDVPANPDGIQAPVPSAGRYYIAEWTPKQTIRLERNPGHPGTDPFFDVIDVDIGLPLATIRLNVESGAVDYGPVPPAAHAELAAQYGPGSAAAAAGRQQWFANASGAIRYLALNHDRPLFGTSPPPPPPAPPTPPSPAPAPPPTQPTRRLASAGLVSGTVAVSASGAAPIRVRCGGATCRGNVALFAPAGTRALTARKPIKLGQARFTIPRGKTKVVRIRLTARALKALKKSRRLRAQAVVTLTQSNGRKTVRRSTVVLKAPRRR